MTSMARPWGVVQISMPGMDGVLVAAVTVLIAFGVVMVASASMHVGESGGDSLHYVNRHLAALAIGVVFGWLVFRTPTHWWQRWSTVLYFVGFALLLLVFVPGLGREANGALRWVAAGPFSLQTSEFMKVFIVLYMAGYLVRRQVEVAYSVWGFVKPILLLVLACAALMMQPDFGTTTVLLMTAFGMLFLGGAPLWQFASLLTAAIGALVALVWISPYRLARVTSFLDPWEHARDSGYQLTLALIAFGRGEWTGVGLGNGIQKQFYLPAAHTDFVMAVIGEEFGLLGTLLVIGMFGLIVWRAYAIGIAAELRGDRFAAYVAYGIGLWLGMQAFVNIGVNVGLLPTKGLTLPFLSYGSNSLIVCCMAIGMLLRVRYENRTADIAREGQWQRA
ncbi:MAG: putative lipid II flippase FtsW [Chromatiaceae bacterium]|nr:putative lipid II flippase FtsW [Gammaproteobacteria bacterium]MCP5298344.1 putative lipid II flippase FtsW [Chromatiaceae bacterium]MCP5423116.1 putative lipid II flippase FtsW [Chromatiaceae bacterium]